MPSLPNCPAARKPRRSPYAWLGVASLLAVGCGRSGLDFFLSDGAAPPPPQKTTSLVCTSAIAATAADAIDGYCSTRANRSPNPAPAGGTAVWSTPLPSTTFTAPDDLVVGGDGTVYATMTTLGETSGQPDTVIALNGADGSVLWTQAFTDQAPGHLFLGQDGRLRVPVEYPVPAMVTLDGAGAVAESRPLPSYLASRFDGFAVGSDGSLLSHFDDAENNQHVAKITPDGALVWSSTATDCTAYVVLTRDDHPVLASCGDSATISELDEAGSTAWQTVLPGLGISDGPAVAPDGSIRVAVYETSAAPGSETMHLVSLDESGSILWNVTLPGTADNVSGYDLAIGADGTTALLTNALLVAVSGAGAVLWQTPASDDTVYQSAVDSNGTLVVSSNAAMAGYDLATGESRWTIASELTPPFAIGLGGTIVSPGVIPPANANYAISLFSDH